MPTPTCENCGTPRPDAFCPACGQPNPVRLTIRGFFSHLSGQLFSLDRGLLRTVVALFQSPGHVSLEFVQGRRIWYTNPLTYWLLAATLQLIALWTVEDAYLLYIQASMQASLETQPKAIEIYAGLFKVDDPLPVLARLTVNGVKAGYTYLGIFLALAFAVGLRLTHGRSNSKFTVAENLVFALYTTSHWTVITAFLLPITFRISPALHSTIGLTGYLIIVFWSSLDFHREGWQGGVRTMLAMIFAFLGYLVVFLGWWVLQIMVAAIQAG